MSFVVLNFFLFLYLVFILQQASLYKSLLLVPLSLTLMFLLKSNLINSGIFFILFVMVFIGGLLVLLVSVSSLSSQEQGVTPNLIFLLVFFIMLCGGFTSQNQSVLADKTATLWWPLESVEMETLFFILLISLFLISLLVFIFKGMVRSLCLFGV